MGSNTAFSTVLAVFENIIACTMDLTGWTRKKTCVIDGILMFILSLPCALGYNVWSTFQPLGEGSAVLDLEDFIVSNCALPLGSLCYVLFCVSKKGWGFENLLAEVNAGKGAKLPRWSKPYITFVVPCAILLVFLIGIFTFKFTDTFTIWGWVKGLF